MTGMSERNRHLIVLGIGLIGLGLGYMTARLNVLYEDVRFLSTT